MTYHYRIVSIAIFAISSAFGAAPAQDPPKLDYANWTLHGKGRREVASDGESVLVAVGDGTDISYWASKPLGFAPKTLYRITFQASASTKAWKGSPVVGLSSYNKDLGFWCPSTWTDYSIVWFSPDSIVPDRSWLRFGQYGLNGEARYRRIKLQRVVPKYKAFGDLRLGSGEILYDDQYQFITHFLQEGNFSRPLLSCCSAFNTNRFLFFDGDSVTYAHEVGEITQLHGRIELHIDWYKSGKLFVEAAGSAGKWEPIGCVAKPGEIAFAVPESLYPTKRLRIRLRAESNQPFSSDFNPGTIQVGAYRYFCTLDYKSRSILEGETTFEPFEGK